MANLKAIAIRLKSVKNIQKITQSMKMVSAAKYARAERDLKAASPYGVGAQSFYENAQVGRDAEGKVVPAEAGQKELYVALTSDRGLCGAIHSSICKAIRNELLEKPNLDNVAIICVGDKSRTNEMLPGVSQLPDYKVHFPVWTSKCLDEQLDGHLDANGLDLLDKMLIYDPSKRISAKQALKHPYFDDLDKSDLPAKPGQFDIPIPT